MVDGGIGWLEAVTDTTGRVGDEERGGLARVDLQRGGGSVFSVFIGRKEWRPEPVMESRHVSVVHTPAEPAAFPVTQPTLRVSPSRSNPANFSHSPSSFLSVAPILFLLSRMPLPPSRICTCKLTDRHWIPSYTNTHPCASYTTSKRAR